MPVNPSDEPRVAFIKATFGLAKRNPVEWADFLVAFEYYTNEMLETAIKSPLDKVIMSVGVARSMLALRDDFNNIEHLRNKVT